MAELHMIQMNLQQPALMAFAGEQGLDSGRDELDLGYVGHAWLRAAFGDLAPRPWRLLMERHPRPGRPVARILGYSPRAAESLADHMARFALPAVEAVCPPESLLGKKLPGHWPAGRRYGFEVLCCPVGRRSRDGVEKDVLLLEADRRPDARLSRAEVYGRWFRSQQSVSGVHIHELRVAGFRLARFLRKTQGGARKKVHGTRPQVLFQGELETTEPDAMLGLLGRGIGRHRAFGFGMVLLRPA